MNQMWNIFKAIFVPNGTPLFHDFPGLMSLQFQSQTSITEYVDRTLAPNPHNTSFAYATEWNSSRCSKQICVYPKNYLATKLTLFVFLISKNNNEIKYLEDERWRLALAKSEDMIFLALKKTASFDTLFCDKAILSI